MNLSWLRAAGNTAISQQLTLVSHWRASLARTRGPKPRKANRGRPSSSQPQSSPRSLPSQSRDQASAIAAPGRLCLGIPATGEGSERRARPIRGFVTPEPVLLIGHAHIAFTYGPGKRAPPCSKRDIPFRLSWLQARLAGRRMPLFEGSICSVQGSWPLIRRHGCIQTANDAIRKFTVSEARAGCRSFVSPGLGITIQENSCKPCLQ